MEFPRITSTIHVYTPLILEQNPITRRTLTTIGHQIRSTKPHKHVDLIHYIVAKYGHLPNALEADYV